MCVDPATAMAIASAASATMTAAGGAVTYAQGKAEEKGYKTAAKQELMNTAVEETAYRQEARKFAANQRLQALAGGGDVASGSTSLVLDEDTRTMELNALMRRYTGETAAENLKFKGRSAARSGAIAGGMALMQAGVEAVGSQSKGDFAAFKKRPTGP